MLTTPKRTYVGTPLDDDVIFADSAIEVQGLGQAAARAAIEADGYKNVRALAKATDGRWTARAMRGPTEIGLTVEPDGSIRAD